MHKIKDSDESALKMLFDRLWERMYLLALSLLKDKEVSKDIVQEIWIGVWERRHEIQNENIEAYLLKATRFKVYKELRDNKLHKTQIDFLERIQSPDPENILEKLYFEDTRAQLERSLGNLPKKCRLVFTLSRFEGFKNWEISQKLGISQRTVETHISNAIKRIKSEVSTGVFLVLSSFF